MAKTIIATSTLANLLQAGKSRAPTSLSLVRHVQSGAKQAEANPRAPKINTPTIHEPEYLADLKPKTGYYELLDLQLKGYDFVVLEKYQSYLNKTMKKMNFKVTKAWSSPHQELQLENLRDRSSAPETSYKIKIYERNIQMKDALTTKLPLLIDIINITSPPGVSFSIERHDKNSDDRLYFRDSVLEKLKEELQELKETPLIGA